jgi:predicted nucleotidyltransferase
MKYGLPDATIQKIHTVLSEFPQVNNALLYGSRAKGNYKNGSDIDLTLYGSANLTRKVLYRIMDELDELLLPYSIDLSLFHEISDTDLITHIQRGGVPFYEKEDPGFLK